MYRIIGADQKEYGPISADQLRQWIAQSRLNRQSKVKPEGATDWVSLGDLPEFAADFSVPGAAIPPAGPSSSAGVAKTSGMAITSLVLGVLGMCGITALVGLILGIVSLIKIKNSQGRLTGSGLAIGGICVSGFMLLFSIPFMAALLLPALAKAKGRAQRIACVNNAKQIGIAIQIYASDNDGQLPASTNWCDAIQTYVGTSKVFQCPASPGSRCSYVFNQNLAGKKTGEVDPQTVLFFEGDAGWNGAGGAESVAVLPKHDRAIVVGFADGSVRSLSKIQLDTLRWEP